ncbi:hypothetical protein [Aliiroseovarius crassostreae]|uniref:hypothetical protein n=1 Tax=Aliiroseovarius crassostreae TaxID=154981 RepID=UPI003C7CB1B1
MRLIFPLLIATSPASAEDPFPTQLQGDFTGDGVTDSAEIIETVQGEGTLHLTLSNAPAVTKSNLVWIGGIGQKPWLERTPQGSLQVFSQNSAIGRNRWEQVLTLAFRDGAMRVAGYTFRWYDTLNLDDIGTCDLNLLSGRGEITLGQTGETTRITVQTRALPVTDWPEDMPAECAKLYQ